ncbi:MAG: hypothetical protein ACRD2P_02685, partial [Terriglobia bacterium]
KNKDRRPEAAATAAVVTQTPHSRNSLEPVVSLANRIYIDSEKIAMISMIRIKYCKYNGLTRH